MNHSKINCVYLSGNGSCLHGNRHGANCIVKRGTDNCYLNPKSEQECYTIKENGVVIQLGDKSKKRSNKKATPPPPPTPSRPAMTNGKSLDGAPPPPPPVAAKG